MKPCANSYNTCQDRFDEVTSGSIRNSVCILEESLIYDSTVWSNNILIFDIKENEWTYNRQLIYQQIYIMNV